GHRGVVPERGHGRVRHRDRAAVPRLQLPHQVEDHRPRHVRARARLARPRRAVQPGADGPAHQPVPGGVELDLVDAGAVAVVGVQHGRMDVGEPRVLLRLRRRDHPGEVLQRRERVARPFPGQCRGERRVAGQRVVVDQGRWLVGHARTVSPCPASPPSTVARTRSGCWSPTSPHPAPYGTSTASSAWCASARAWTPPACWTRRRWSAPASRWPTTRPCCVARAPSAYGWWLRAPRATPATATTSSAWSARPSGWTPRSSPAT